MHFQLKNSGIWRSAGVTAILLITNICAVSGQAPDPQPETFAGPPPATMLPNEKRNPEILLWPNGAPGSEGKTEGVRYRTLNDRLVHLHEGV